MSAPSQNSDLKLDSEEMEHILSLKDSLNQEASYVQKAKAIYENMAKECRRDVPFQKNIRKRIMNFSDPAFCLEAATGSGKSFIAAFHIEDGNYLERGPVIFVSHSGIILRQVRTKFIKTLPDYQLLMGQPNEFSRANKIHFLTPQKIKSVRKNSPKLFNRVFNEASIMIIDEAHHYPLDEKGRLKIFGDVERLAKKYFENRGKRVLAMTATHTRNDGQVPMGKVVPDYQFTIQNANDAGCCPNIHGIQVHINVNPDTIRKTGEFYAANMSDVKQKKYLDLITKHIVYTHERLKKPFCVFVSRVKDAEYIADYFNKLSGLNDNGMAMLIGKVADQKRQDIIENINNGKIAGYITCNVGAEGIDIPSLEIVHMVTKTSSIIRLIQMIGRALRIADGKKRTLIIDYHFKKNVVIKGCVGLFEYGKNANSWLYKIYDRKKKMPKVAPVISQQVNEQLYKSLISKLEEKEEEIWIKPYSVNGNGKSRPYHEALKFVHSLNLERRVINGRGLKDTWEAYCRGEFKDLPPKPDDIPTHPNQVYRKRKHVLQNA